MRAPYALLFALLIAIMNIRSTDCSDGMLYPRASETRELISLDGIWNFVASPMSDPLVGFRKDWYKIDLAEVPDVEVLLMPVPSSYNDITQNINIRDHVGVVWYERTFFVPNSWANNSLVWLRFSSVSYAAQVWINGQRVMEHEMGHLPFQKKVHGYLKFGKKNKVTVACDNTLLQGTVPQGMVYEEVGKNGNKKMVQNYTFDFFNYAGIHRPVTLYTTPKNYVDDISVNTEIVETLAIVHYNISIVNVSDVTCSITLLDKSGNTVVSEKTSGEGALKVPSAKLWWPYLMDKDPGYMYTLQVELSNLQGEVIDIYRQPLGIRTISWNSTSVLINERPIYFHGFGRHEDADIRGKGLDFPTIVRDHNLIKWIGANAYRTSHYPYADEIMDLADQLGIMIIDECASVDTVDFSDTLLEKHKDSLTELYRRDKNRPSVVMWSIANEPRSQTELAGQYFGEVAQHIKSLDSTRPITLSVYRSVEEDKSGVHLDVISFNRYNAWYFNTGQLDMITDQLITEATEWHEKHNKPVLMSEYGADTMPGLHISPSYVWSEEFQVQLMSRHFQAFDKLRNSGWFIGEFIWNFADFKTAQTFTRVGGNKKGIFTRDRQPKASAHHLRKRYFSLARELYNATIPDDLYDYVASNAIHDEL